MLYEWNRAPNACIPMGEMVGLESASGSPAPNSMMMLVGDVGKYSANLHIIHFYNSENCMAGCKPKSEVGSLRECQVRTYDAVG